MLSSWFSLFLVVSVNRLSNASGQRPLTLAPTCRIKGHLKTELTVNCGDGIDAGVVQFWHTPFGDLRAPGLHSNMDPVFMHPDGSLVLPNSSRLHSGLYYCLLQHAEGTTLWPYQLHVGEKHEDGGEERDCGVIRIRRSSGSEEAESGVLDGDLAAAVAVSVLLTFVFGFSAGALSRAQVLRCLETLSRKLPSLWQRQPSIPDDDSDISVSTLPPMYKNVSFEVGQDDITMETVMPSTTSSPPVKPQRSFRVKREELQETATYLKGCDPKMEERKVGEEEEEEQGVSGFYLGVDGGCQGETDVGGEEQETEGNEEEERDKTEEKDGKKDKNNSQHLTIEDDMRKKAERIQGGAGREEASASPPRCSRVIRLYEYNEDGHRYGHLPDPAPEPPVPAPRLKQRSLSLTRLNSITAAASAGPLDREGARGEDGEWRPHFHMEI